MFTPEERNYLTQQRIGRIATTSQSGEPDVAPVEFSVDGDNIDIGSVDNRGTRKYHNARSVGRASFVVDDFAPGESGGPRGLKITGPAEIVGPAEQPKIRIRAETIWSWGLNPDAPKYFAGMFEKRGA